MQYSSVIPYYPATNNGGNKRKRDSNLFTNPEKTAANIMEDNGKLSAERSIEIISEAIRTSRREAGRSAGNLMTAWGALSVGTSIIVAILWNHTGNEQWNWIWAATAVAGYGYYQYIKKKERRKHTAATFASKVLEWVWMTFLCVACCAVLLRFNLFIDDASGINMPLYPTAILLLSMAGGITGLVTSNGASSGCAVMSIYWAQIAAEKTAGGQAAAMALASLFALLIPGLLIKYKEQINKFRQEHL